MKRKQGIAWLLLCCLLLASTGGVLPAARADADDLSSAATELPKAKQNTYGAYLLAHGDPSGQTPDARIELAAADVLETDAFVTDYMGKNGVLFMDVPGLTYSWTFTAEEAGYYRLALDYIGLPGKNYDITLDVFVDGEIPYTNTQGVKLHRLFLDETYAGTNDNVFLQNIKGDEIMPSLTEQFEWQTQLLYDSQSAYPAPLDYWLDAGEHTLALRLREESFALASVVFCNPDETESYADVLNRRADAVDTSGALLVYEAEKSFLKNDVTLFPTYDTAYSHVTPASAENILYNTIGKNTWKKIGQEITWEIEAPETGFYELAFKVKQYDKSNAYVTRAVTIDGCEICREANAQKFPYKTGWYVQRLETESGEPIRVYLTKGRHVLGMQAVLDEELAEVLRGVNGTMEELQGWYREIIKITGFNADEERITIDANRDFHLEKTVPGLIEGLQQCKDKLDGYYRRIDEITGISTASASILSETSTLLGKLIKRPKRIVPQIETLRADISSLATWVIDMQTQPLQMDKFYVFSPDVRTPKVESGFFKQLAYRLRMFFHSFSGSTTAVAGTVAADETASSIRVWISTADITTTGASSGRDQAIILKRLIDESFTAQTGINVEVSLVSGSDTLVQAVLAGEGPDVALFTSTDTPVNLAMRGAVLDLSRFEGFSDTVGQFTESAVTPFWYQGGCYAFPETQNFNVLFYRTDIYDELGLEPPKTWEEFYEQVIFLSNNNYMVGVPQNQNIFETFLYQSGSKFYTDDFSASTFDTEPALKAFESWTGLYTKYSLSLIFDFFNRFRSGEMALAIEPYNQVNYLYSAAPELDGLWDIAVLPSTVREDGSESGVVTCSSTGCIALKGTEHPEEAYRFLSWWVSGKTQGDFGTQVEQTLGVAARYGTANLEAFERIPWSAEQAAIIREQRSRTVAVEQIPGNYYIARNLAFAFRAVVYNKANLRETLYKYNIEINKELARKQKEFSYR
ncbi:MAG: extracellular solute-binding protein [Clostridia bacterium]|nr:extracellular solute-binding protein [Clostridia bacterium]